MNFESFKSSNFELFPSKSKFIKIGSFKAYIPYENHNVTEHSRVLLYYHPKKDLIGIKLRVIRGAYDVSSKPPTKKKRLYYLKNFGKNIWTLLILFLARKDRFNENKLKAIEDWRPEPVRDEYNFMWKDKIKKQKFCIFWLLRCKFWKTIAHKLQ